MIKLKMRDRLSNGINAGSMADIAFLLLIFFLVTTTIQVDKGILVKMPPYDPNVPPTDIASRNVFQIWVNANNEFLVRGDRMSLKEIKPKIKQFIINPESSSDLAISPNKAVVSLKNDRGTNYTTYVEVYNEIKAAYNELWDEQAQTKYKKDYENCTLFQKREIRKNIPLVISEAEPSNHGEL